jgi:hypothetical protein
MANDTTQSQLVLAQNQYALIQDTTKGTVLVYAGPHNGAIGQNEQAVVYDRATDRYTRAGNLQDAIKQNPLVSEGEYLVLENPVLGKEGLPQPPPRGGAVPTDLRIGSKINVPGPLTFPRWRCYVFEPAAGTVYSAGCMNDIAAFCEGTAAECRESSSV